MFIHQGAKLAADLRGFLGAALFEQAVEDPSLFFPRLGLRHIAQLGALGQVPGDLAARDPAPNQAFGGGVASQAVGPVHRVARHLARGPDVFHFRPAIDIGFDPAHRIMRDGPDGNGCRDGIDSEKLHTHFADQRQALVDAFGAQMGQIEVDVIKAVGTLESRVPRGFPSFRSGKRCRAAQAPSFWARTSP